MSVYDFKTTAIDNQTADPNINWREGQLPSTINDSARAMMAAIAGARDDFGGALTAGGTDNAITLALSQEMRTVNYAALTFTASHTNTGACTLKVDNTSALPLRAVAGVDLVAGQIVTGRMYTVRLSADKTWWFVAGVTLINSMFATMPAGTVKANLSGSAAVPTDATLADLFSAGSSGLVPTTRTISTTSPLTGGGALSANLTLALANSGVTAGSYNLGVSGVVVADALGRITSMTAGTAFPALTGNGKKVLTTDGSALSFTSLALTANGSFVATNLANPTATFANNMSVARTSAGVWRATLSGLANANYSVTVTNARGGSAMLIPYVANKTSTYFDISFPNYTNGSPIDPTIGEVIDINVFGGL